MSRKERDRPKVVEAVREKRFKRRAAARQLILSVREVKQLVRAHREEGAAELASKRRGQPSNRRIYDAERAEIMVCVCGSYADFGPTPAAEYLRSFHGFTRSTETLRRWMIEADAWTPKRQSGKQLFELYEPRSCIGEPVQIDGTPHAWPEVLEPR